MGETQQKISLARLRSERSTLNGKTFLINQFHIHSRARFRCRIRGRFINLTLNKLSLVTAVRKYAHQKNLKQSSGPHFAFAIFRRAECLNEPQNSIMTSIKMSRTLIVVVKDWVPHSRWLSPFWNSEPFSKARNKKEKNVAAQRHFRTSMAGFGKFNGETALWEPTQFSRWK